MAESEVPPDDVEALLAKVSFDAAGLVPAVVQDALDGEVRMVAYMDASALRRTLETGVGTFWSRSRRAPWVKGETSGNTLAVREVRIDCDGDCVLLRVDPAGPTCHTGAPSCFYRASAGGAWVEAGPPRGELESLFATLEARRAAGAAERSYTRQLLDAGPARIGEKLREEADELSRAVASEDDGRVTSEAADVLFHTLVALVSRGVSWRLVLAELRRRSGVSGLVEKASRGSAPRC